MCVLEASPGRVAMYRTDLTYERTRYMRSDNGLQPRVACTWEDYDKLGMNAMCRATATTIGMRPRGRGFFILDVRGMSLGQDRGTFHFEVQSTR